MNEVFSRIARRTAHLAGSAWAFLLAVGLVVGWALSGPIFHFSETWQLVINTGTTIITFLMVFLIQSSQNHDSTAMQIKLDELIRAMDGAKNSMISLESSTEDEMQQQEAAIRRLAGLHDPSDETGTAALLDDAADHPAGPEAPSRADAPTPPRP